MRVCYLSGLLQKRKPHRKVWLDDIGLDMHFLSQLEKENKRPPKGSPLQS